RLEVMQCKRVGLLTGGEVRDDGPALEILKP
ncbi:MAG: hypothetical protein RL710_3290, partial [Pseudomonadota bacterium]